MGLRGSVEYKFIYIYTEKIYFFNGNIIISYIVIKNKNFILCLKVYCLYKPETQPQ